VLTLHNLLNATTFALTLNSLLLVKKAGDISNETQIFVNFLVDKTAGETDNEAEIFDS